MKINKLKIKRLFDIFFSILGLLIFGFTIIIFAAISTLDTKKNGFFLQKRIGYQGKYFHIIKIRTMRENDYKKSNITLSNDSRITKFGRFLRKYKIDELPQLVNIVKGEMSFVGPRPDLKEYIDLIPENDKKIILSVKPGLTSPASLWFKNEEYLLSKQKDPIKYNNDILIPLKTKLNIEYIQSSNIIKDFVIIIQTIFTLTFIYFKK